MPSPIGHSLAGVIAAWTADLVPGTRAWRTGSRSDSWYTRAGDGLTLLCAGLAALADADLFSPAPVHRAYSHSIGAVILITIIAAVVTAGVTRNRGLRTGITIRVALMCGAAYGTHVLLDWLAFDDSVPYGVRALWPFTTAWYISGWDVFPGTARLGVFSRGAMLQNLRAIVQEVAILVPIAWGVWLVRVKALARFASQIPGRDHPAK